MWASPWASKCVSGDVMEQQHTGNLSMP
jgi:hypothetical protein